jgi:hypothetical protein
MNSGAKIHAKGERDEKRKRTIADRRAEKDAAAELASIDQTGREDLTPADVVRLQGAIGNRAVSRLLAEREQERDGSEGGDGRGLTRADVARMQATLGNRAVASLMARAAPEEEEMPEDVDLGDTRHIREADADADYPGPRQQQRNNGQQRDDADDRASEAERAMPSSSATGDIGDAFNLDGQGLYGWDRSIRARDVAKVVNGIIPTQSSEEEMPRIVIFSGTHGTTDGDLVNNNVSRGFVGEDQATAAATMAANPDVQVEVIDVVNSYRTMPELLAVYGMTDYIRILAWCYSKRSYELGDLICSNWWPEPDNL